MAEFARLLKAATAKYLKGAANETIQNSILLSKMQKRGRIKYNQTGKTLDWRLKYKQRALNGREDMEHREFARKDLYKELTLPWRGYSMEDAISRKERLMCRGDEALIQIWPERMRPSDVELLLCDYGKFNRATGWKPEIPFEKTIADLLDYWRERV